MTAFTLAGVLVALLSLIFSTTPFIQLVYMIAIQGVIDWEQFGVVTFIMIVASLGSTLYRRLSS